MSVKRILICGDRNQFIPFNYSLDNHSALASLGLNSGNAVFGFSIQKITMSKTVKVDMKPISWIMKNPDIINESYDICLYSPANILAVWAKERSLNKWSDLLQKIKIPFTFIGVGAQSTYDYSLDFVATIKDEGYRFIKSILETGGKLALRGYFTAEVVKKLGFLNSDFEVLGCPSLFMNGAGLVIDLNKLNVNSQCDLKPIFNGYTFYFNKNYHHFFTDYPTSVYICQDIMYKMLYDISSFNDEYFLFQDGLFLELFKQNRIQMFCTFPEWQKYLIDNKFNFSIGSRIHGNIVSLLSGIPCYIEAIDSRVRELAEFFEIPYGSIKNPNLDLYDIFSKLDYKNFNTNFNKKFYNFKKFLNEQSIPCFDDAQYINEKLNSILTNFTPPPPS